MSYFDEDGRYDRPDEMTGTELERATATELTRLRARRAAEQAVDAEAPVPAMRRLGRRTIATQLEDALAELAVKHEHGIQGFRLGMPAVDEKLGGILSPGRLIVVAGYQKQGKSTFLGQVVTTLAAQGVHTLLGSFEDDPNDSVFRYLANLSSGNVGTIRDGFRRPDGTKLPVPESFATAAQKLASLNIETIASRGTAEEIAYEVQDWWTEHSAQAPFGAVVIDQLSHIIPSNRKQFMKRFPGIEPPPSENKTDMLEWQVDLLGRMARRLNLLVIVAAQLNTTAKEWEQPSERSIRSSQGIAHKANAVLIPWRPSKIANPARGVGEPEWVPNDAGRAWIVCPIAREIEMGWAVEVEWHGAQQRFAELGDAPATPWTAPKALTAEQMSGMNAWSALRRRQTAQLDAVVAVANGAVPLPVPELESSLPALTSTPGAAWPALEPKPAPASPARPELPVGGFGGGGRSVVKPELF